MKTNPKPSRLERSHAPRFTFSDLLLFVLALAPLCAFSPLAKAAPPQPVDHLGRTFSAPFVTNITTTAVTLFATNASVSADRVLKRVVQNNGTVPVLYSINNTNTSATSYHGILAGGSALRDGLGSVLDVSAVNLPITFRTEAGSAEISIVEIKQ